MGRQPIMQHHVLFFLIILIILLLETCAQIPISPKTEETTTGTHSRNPVTARSTLQKRSNQGSGRKRVVIAGAAREGSIYDGLRSDYLLTVTLPWTLAMFGFVIFILICMRTDGWLYRLFTEDYVPPAVKKRLEEEARKAEGRKAKGERADNWNEERNTWERNLRESTEKVKATMPPTGPIKGRCRPPHSSS